MSEDETTTEDLTYRGAAEEIDTILSEIDGEADVDIDELADRVERASKLIAFCLDRLKGAELRVRKVTEELARTAAESADEPDSDD